MVKLDTGRRLIRSMLRKDKQLGHKFGRHSGLELEKLATRSYKTYLARLKAAERLQGRNRAWNTCLLSLSVATTIASIALLTEPAMYGPAGATVLVCVSVMALVASLVVAGLNYGGRSRDMFMNYRRIQRVSVEAETLFASADPSAEQTAALSERYDALLDDSENHTTADHIRATGGEGFSRWITRRANALTALPYVALLVPLAVLLPVIFWAARVAG